MKIQEDDYLAHYGILRKSGRYPWGSGGTESQRNRDFLAMYDDLRKQGLSDAEICEGFSTDDYPFNQSMLRAAKAIAGNQQQQERINQAERLKERGWGPTKIGERMGLPESTVRGLLAPGARDKAAILTNTANVLEKELHDKGFIDVGVGTHLAMDVTETKFKNALAILQEKGYAIHTIPVPTGPGKYTNVKMLCPPGTTWGEAAKNVGNIKQIGIFNEDGGRATGNLGIQFPMSVSSKRLAIRYAEDGGTNADGVIYVRRGVKDLSIGSNAYAQVRVAVDGSHYLKGMAVYKDDLPAGIDLEFNTNKSNTGNKLDALKKFKTNPDGTVDMDNPFGAMIKRQLIETDSHGKEVVTSAMNIVRDEGDWSNWSKSLSSQILSKQLPTLAKQQLDLTYEKRLKAFEEINALTNPAVKKKLLQSFADSADAAAVHLKAATLPGSSYHVIMPVQSMKETEVFAPNFVNGTRLALIRSPHGGTFEIPELVVNNKNREARSLLGVQAKDAVGIHPKVAERLSGADFDGDFVIAVPNNSGKIKTTPALEGLKGFDPKHAFPAYDGMKTIDGGTWDATKKETIYPKRRDGTVKRPTQQDQLEMGKITNLIADMTIHGATDDELAQAVRHSMVVIDANKHVLDYKSSYTANGIPKLKEKYQGGTNAGASTLITKSTQEFRVNQRVLRKASQGGPIDPETGRKVYVPTGKSYLDSKGRTVFNKSLSTRGAETTDAFTLSSGTAMEDLYAAYANNTKALANAARREYLATKPIRYDKSAKTVYYKEVASLNEKLERAQRNAPRERQAQALTNAVVKQRKQANPYMDEADEKKIRTQALNEMRERTGAKKDRIQISQSEWDAIQAGAISNDKLEKILANTDVDVVKKLATPKEEVLMTPTYIARAKTMASKGFTQAEIAAQLGVSLTTLKTGLSGE